MTAHDYPLRAPEAAIAAIKVAVQNGGSVRVLPACPRSLSVTPSIDDTRGRPSSGLV
jgi:hypothetical protein